MLVQRAGSLRRVVFAAATVLGAGLSLALAGCGDDEPIIVINWPEMSGSFQYRSLMPLDASGLTCVEHGDIDITHPGENTWSASGNISLDCWLDGERISDATESIQFSNGAFGDETNKASWAITWQGRTGWSYSGEVFWVTERHMKATGVGTGIVDIPGGGSMTRDFSWTICREFEYQNDPVEQGCVYTG